MSADENLRAVLAPVAEGAWLHSVDLDSGAEVALNADDRVTISSVAKILLVLEFARQAEEGLLHPAERVTVVRADRLGGFGISGSFDDVELSLRDLAYFAMTVSDNAAADVLLRRVGLARMRALAVELGLARTRIVGGPREQLESMMEDVGAPDPERFAELYAGLSPEQVWRLRALDPEHSNSSTARDMTLLLRRIWDDTAAPAAACAMVRDLMSRQLFRNRLASGFPADIAVAGKTGTLPGLHNEVGVVEYPDGGRYAIAAFVRTPHLGSRRIEVDLAIGRAGRAAVSHLRGTGHFDGGEAATLPS